MVKPQRRSALFLLGLTMLVVKHAQFRAPRALSLLTPDFLDPLLLGGFDRANFRLDFIEQKPPRQKAIEPLGALLLALHPDASGPMMEHYTGLNFIDVLAAGAGGADELLVDILLADAKSQHALRKLFFFIG